jgi:hypothetical protein
MARRDFFVRHRRVLVVTGVFLAAATLGGLVAFFTRDHSAARVGTPIAPTTRPSAPPSTSAPSPAPAIVSFVVPPTVTCTATTTFPFSWSTANAAAVAISVDGVVVDTTLPAAGTLMGGFVCDGAAHAYTLTVTGDGPPATRSVTVSKG